MFVLSLAGEPALTHCQLDRASVKWLEDYLISQKHITCLIVSHDAG